MQSYVEGFCDIPNIDEIIYPEHEQEKPSKDRSKLGGFGCTREKGPIKTSILFHHAAFHPISRPNSHLDRIRGISALYACRLHLLRLLEAENL